MKNPRGRYNEQHMCSHGGHPHVGYNIEGTDFATKCTVGNGNQACEGI
jgi:hypothetical protein